MAGTHRPFSSVRAFNAEAIPRYAASFAGTAGLDWSACYSFGRPEKERSGVSNTRPDANSAPFRLLMRVPVPWVFVLTYLIGVALEHVWPLHFGAGASTDMALRVGAIVFTVGAVIAGWGLVTFRKARTTTVPGRASSRLVTWGPYRVSRNPMYVGLAVAYLGEAILLHQVWPPVLLPLVLGYVNWVVIPVEEAKLTEVFGAEYGSYQRRVRRWL
jgi:protein-S-isoprenylcysteine O-methyltransferase Ste14